MCVGCCLTVDSYTSKGFNTWFVFRAFKGTDGQTVRLGRCGPSDQCYENNGFNSDPEIFLEYNTVLVRMPSESPSYGQATDEEPVQRLSLAQKSTAGQARINIGVFRNTSLSHITHMRIDTAGCQDYVEQCRMTIASMLRTLILCSYKRRQFGDTSSY